MILSDDKPSHPSYIPQGYDVSQLAPERSFQTDNEVGREKKKHFLTGDSKNLGLKEQRSKGEGAATKNMIKSGFVGPSVSLHSKFNKKHLPNDVLHKRFSDISRQAEFKQTNGMTNGNK